MVALGTGKLRTIIIILCVKNAKPYKICMAIDGFKKLIVCSLSLLIFMRTRSYMTCHATLSRSGLLG